MKIYIGCEDGDHNATGLILISEAALEAWLIADLGFTAGEPSLVLAKENISQRLKDGGVCSLWTGQGTQTFISEEVIRKTAGIVLMEDFFRESSRKRFADKVIEELKKKGLSTC